jgi:hypothetical protein
VWAEIAPPLAGGHCRGIAKDGSGDPTRFALWGIDCGEDSEAAGDRLRSGLRRSGRGSPLGEEALWHEPVLAALQTFKRVICLDEVQKHLAVAL